MIVLEEMMQGRRARGSPRRRWVQEVIDDMRMTAADADQLAQNMEFFRTAVMGARLRKGQVT
uniref:Uncharacterized protein n=1 Tax=Arion vulgaris TaxID=1028688 RepID=A0A0B6Z3R6_9EUPU